jgi:ketosteroid isomerase-like protein
MAGAGGRSEREAIVRGVVDALNDGDWDRALAALAPDFEYDLTRTISPLRGVHPRERMRAVVEEFLGPWESVRYEPEEPASAGDQVVMPFKTHFRGRDGIEVASQAAWVWTFRGEEIVRLALYQDLEEALADAGAGPA